MKQLVPLIFVVFLLVGCGDKASIGPSFDVQITNLENYRYLQNGILELEYCEKDFGEIESGTPKVRVIVQENEDWNATPGHIFITYIDNKNAVAAVNADADPEKEAIGGKYIPLTFWKPISRRHGCYKTTVDAFQNMFEWIDYKVCPFDKIAVKAEYRDQKEGIVAVGYQSYGCDLPEQQVVEVGDDEGSASIIEEVVPPETGADKVQELEEENKIEPVEEGNLVQVENEDDHCAPLQGPDVLASDIFGDKLLCGNFVMRQNSGGEQIIKTRYSVKGEYRPFMNAEKGEPRKTQLRDFCIQADNLSTGELGIATCGYDIGSEGEKGSLAITSFNGDSGDNIRVTLWAFNIGHTYTGDGVVEFFGYDPSYPEKSEFIPVDINGIEAEFCIQQEECTFGPDAPSMAIYQVEMKVP